MYIEINPVIHCFKNRKYKQKIGNCLYKLSKKNVLMTGDSAVEEHKSGKEEHKSIRIQHLVFNIVAFLLNFELTFSMRKCVILL